MLMKPPLQITPVVLNALMSDYLRRVGRFYGLIAAVPFIIAFIGAWSDGLGFFLFILGIPAAFIVLVVGSVMWFVRSYWHGREVHATREKFATYAAAPTLLVVTIGLSWPTLALGNYIGTMSRLMLNQGHYEAIIAKVRANPKPAWYQDDDGVTYSVHLGPPIRIAFNPAGMLDNWSGIIYDPTGDVMLADGFDPKTGEFAAPDKVTKLFNGDLVRCRRLWGDYYDCSFT